MKNESDKINDLFNLKPKSYIRQTTSVKRVVIPDPIDGMIILYTYFVSKDESLNNIVARLSGTLTTIEQTYAGHYLVTCVLNEEQYTKHFPKSWTVNLVDCNQVVLDIELDDLFEKKLFVFIKSNDDPNKSVRIVVDGN